MIQEIIDWHGYIHKIPQRIDENNYADLKDLIICIFEQIYDKLKNALKSSP